MHLHRFFKVVAALLIPLQGLCATTPAPASGTPEELATVLITSMSPARDGSTARVSYGKLTSDFPAALLPGGFRVLGGLDTDMLSYNVAATALTEADARAAVDAAFTAAGWRRPSVLPPPFMVSATGGFMPSMRPIPTMSYCGPDDAPMSAMILPRPAGGSYVKWSVSKAAALSAMGATTQCSRSQAGADQSRELAALRSMPPMLAMPELRAPDGMTQMPGGGSSSGNTRSVTASLRGSMPMADVIRHYAAQMEQAGWTTVGSSATTAASVQTFSKSGERFQTATLTIRELSGGYGLSLQVMAQ